MLDPIDRRATISLPVLRLLSRQDEEDRSSGNHPTYEDKEQLSEALVVHELKATS
jgi:hypothetical protein